MNVRLRYLLMRTKKTTERIEFSEVVTFVHGPISKGKSTIARLIDYCLGGELERVPAIQSEFVSSELSITLGYYDCLLERGAEDTQAVRVTWTSTETKQQGSVNAPLDAKDDHLVDDEDVFNLSDLLFYLCGVTPIKVRKRSSDPDSQVVRLSFRDVWWYCYLDQTHLDSSFYRLEDPFRGRKSQDAMRFFTGLHSERLSQLEEELSRTLENQRVKREAVAQIRAFMSRFEFGSALEMDAARTEAKDKLAEAESRRTMLEETRTAETHPTDGLREELRRLGSEVNSIRQAIAESTDAVEEQIALQSELITAKTKAIRSESAVRVLEKVKFHRCPECGTDISDRRVTADHCRVCSSDTSNQTETGLELEVLRRDLNERIDQIGDSITRRKRESTKMERQLNMAEARKDILDRRLQDELRRYDSAFVESIRLVDSQIATYLERIRSIEKLQQLPAALDALTEEAGALQGRIDQLRIGLADERTRLQGADQNIAAIAAEFKRIMLAIGFPGMREEDRVVIDPRNWNPYIVHGQQEWSFSDAGSGGKKTLFNVCYALAVHSVATMRDMPVPSVLIVDSPTKNISQDENPELVQALYREIYRLCRLRGPSAIQFILVDSHLVSPEPPVLEGFYTIRMAGTRSAPALISYYDGP